MAVIPARRAPVATRTPPAMWPVLLIAAMLYGIGWTAGKTAVGVVVALRWSRDAIRLGWAESRLNL